MKMRFFAYLIILPVILLLTFALPVVDWLKYVSWAAFILAIALLIFAFVKTKEMYKTKKIWFVLLFLLASFCTVENVYAQVNPTNSYGVRQQFDPCANADSELKLLRQARLKLSKIPLANRTSVQQKEYDDTLKKMNDLMTQCQIQPCPDISDLYMEAVEDCWICDVAKLFLVAGDKVVTVFYDNVTKKGYALALLAIGFFMWILVRVLSLVGSFGATDIGKFFTDFFVKCLFVGGTAALLLVPLRDTADFFISPFFIFSSMVNQKLIEISDEAVSGGSFVKIDELMYKKFGKKVECEYCEKLNASASAAFDGNIDSILKHQLSSSKQAIPGTLANAILCSVCSIYRITTPPVVSGQFLFCSAKQLTRSIPPKEDGKVYRDYDAVIVGGILAWTFIGITAIFSFYLIDAFVRLCFVFVLFPFLLVAFVFQSTRQYTKKGLDVLIHSMVTYIVVCVFMLLLIQIFYTMLGPVSKGIVDALASEEPYQALHDTLTFIGSGGFACLCCVAITFLTFFMLQIMHGCIAEISGVDLSNGGGIAGFRTTLGKFAATSRFAQELYNQPSWTNIRRKARDENGNLKGGTDKAVADIESGGRWLARPFESSGGKTENFLNTISDKAINAADSVGEKAQSAIDRTGTKAAEGMFNFGKSMFTPHALATSLGFSAIVGVASMVGAGATYVGTKIAVGTIWLARKTVKMTTKIVSRLISKTAKTIVRTPGIFAKKIAYNKYFNRTVGFVWSDAKDTYNDVAPVWNWGKKKYDKLKSHWKYKP
ncbi:MAG: hypothetical protein ACI4RJ_01390 [Alphaproteobacteria bacterium]